jgi:hypothetical protein
MSYSIQFIFFSFHLQARVVYPPFETVGAVVSHNYCAYQVKHKDNKDCQVICLSLHLKQCPLLLQLVKKVSSVAS